MKTELLITIIASSMGVISTLITTIGYVKTRREEIRAKAKARQDEIRRKLALNIIGYYYEEQLLTAELAKYTNESEITIKKNMRTMAEQHLENKEKVRPKMTANDARDYIKTTN